MAAGSVAEQKGERLDKARITKGVATTLAAALVLASLPVPAAATQRTAIAVAASVAGGDQTWSNAYGHLLVADILVPSTGRHERRVVFTSFRAERFELSTDMVSGKTDLVLPSGSASFHFLPNGAYLLQVSGTSGPVTSAFLTKDGAVRGADGAKIRAAVQSALAPSRQVLDDLGKFLAAEDLDAGLQSLGGAQVSAE